MWHLSGESIALEIHLDICTSIASCEVWDLIHYVLYVIEDISKAIKWLLLGVIETHEIELEILLLLIICTMVSPKLLGVLVMLIGSSVITYK